MDQVEVKLYQLDPEGRHAPADLSSVRDWSLLYTAVEKTRAQPQPRHADLYPLAAMQHVALSPQAAMRREYLSETRGNYATPGAAIARTNLLRTLQTSLMFMSSIGSR